MDEEERFILKLLTVVVIVFLAAYFLPDFDQTQTTEEICNGKAMEQYK